MSYSTYVLNQKISNLQYDVNTLIPSSLGAKVAALQVPALPTILSVVDSIQITDGTSNGNNTYINSAQLDIANGTTNVYSSLTPTAFLIDDLTQSTTLNANLATFEKSGDTHQTHIDNTQVHILDTETLDEMFIDHNSLILVQPSTTHQTELLGNMLDFQTPENIVSCGHTTYQNGHPGFEVYDLSTGNNALLTYAGLNLVDAVAGNNVQVEPNIIAMNSGSGAYLNLQSGTIQMNTGYDSVIIQPTVVSVQGLHDTQVNTFKNKIDFVQSLVIVNTLDASNWSGGIKSEATVMNASHYITGSMSSTTGSNKLQKSSNIYFNPSLQTLYSTTFSGNLTGTASIANTVNTNTYNLATTCYIPFTSSAAGSGKALYVDDTTGPLSYVPSTSTLTALIFSGALSGNATSATTVSTVSDNTAGTFYLPFVKTTAIITPNQQIYIDDTTGPLTYNPSTGALSSTSFVGSLSGASSGVNLPTTQNLATFATGVLTWTGLGSQSFKNSNIIFTGTTNIVATLTTSTQQVNGEYYLSGYNAGSGNLTFNYPLLGTNIKTTYSSGVNISPLTYFLMKINVLVANAITLIIVDIKQLS